MKPAQVRMARAALNWSLQQLADTSGVHRNTISNFETGRYGGEPATLAAVRAALEAAGVEFTNGGQPGVRMKKQTPERREFRPGDIVRYRDDLPPADIGNAGKLGRLVEQGVPPYPTHVYVEFEGNAAGTWIEMGRLLHATESE